MKKLVPPKWMEVLPKAQDLANLLMDGEVRRVLEKANQNYLHWDKFQYQPMPKEVSPKVAWALLKMMRIANRESLPIIDERGHPFSFLLTKEHLKSLSYIDTHASGAITTSEILPAGQQRDRLVINGLIEEAISSSQIEGANTTRKVAKAMIEMNRSPRTRDEQMIYNNYVAMTQLEEWKKRPLSDEFLLELHRVLMRDTMDDPGDVGRFRVDADEIVVHDKSTGEVVHEPPLIEDARKQLAQLYEFANADDEDQYVHPFVKASILHFCFGYIHPFVDGNGRSARALFYWYLLRKGYWMFKFLPISLQIKKKERRDGYDRAFQYVESDEGDITYFLSYKLKLVKSAIEDFIKYLEQKQIEANKLKDKLVESDEINSRQLELIDFFQRNPNADMSVKLYKEKNKIVYETARSDLMALADRGILKQGKTGKKYVFTRGENFPSK